MQNLGLYSYGFFFSWGHALEYAVQSLSGAARRCKIPAE